MRFYAPYWTSEDSVVGEVVDTLALLCLLGKLETHLLDNNCTAQCQLIWLILQSIGWCIGCYAPRKWGIVKQLAVTGIEILLMLMNNYCYLVESDRIGMMDFFIFQWIPLLFNWGKIQRRWCAVWNTHITCPATHRGYITGQRYMVLVCVSYSR